MPIRRSFLPDDIDLFVDYSKTKLDYSDLMDFFKSKPTLTNTEIASTWDTNKHGEIKDFNHSHCIMMAEMRAFREIMALKSRPEDPAVIDEYADFVVKLLCKINNEWREVRRFDTAHDNVHEDIFIFTGQKDRTIVYYNLDNKSGLDHAITTYKKKYLEYIRGFIYENKKDRRS